MDEKGGEELPYYDNPFEAVYGLLEIITDGEIDFREIFYTYLAPSLAAS